MSLREEDSSNKTPNTWEEGPFFIKPFSVPPEPVVCIYPQNNTHYIRVLEPHFTDPQIGTWFEESTMKNGIIDLKSFESRLSRDRIDMYNNYLDPNTKHYYVEWDDAVLKPTSYTQAQSLKLIAKDLHKERVSKMLNEYHIESVILGGFAGVLEELFKEAGDVVIRQISRQSRGSKGTNTRLLGRMASGFCVGAMWSTLYSLVLRSVKVTLLGMSWFGWWTNMSFDVGMNCLLRYLLHKKTSKKPGYGLLAKEIVLYNVVPILISHGVGSLIGAHLKGQTGWVVSSLVPPIINSFMRNVIRVCDNFLQ